jgi:hypothetical protein
MSGPQGPDATQPWQPQGEDQQSTGGEATQQASPWQQPSGEQTWQQPAGEQTWQQPAGEQTWQAPSGEQPTWHAPAYTPTEYPQYQQPPAQYYPPSGPFPQPTAYPPQEQYGGAQTGQYGAQPGQYAQPGPYGQPGQYGQYPPGQPGQYPQPGPYGQPPAGPGAKRSRTVIGTVIGVFAAIVVAVALVLGFWAPGFFVTTKLDVKKAQAGVQQILTDDTNGYGAKNVKDVKCNDGQDPTVKKGGTFDCDVSIDGTKRQVTVTFRDNKGTYEVGRPK